MKRRLGTLIRPPNQDPRHNRRATLQEISLKQPWAAAVPGLSWSHLPLECWQLVLGSGLHVGTAFWPRWAESIDEAETEWCRLVAERLEVQPGQRILEIGASPGAVSRWAESEQLEIESTLLASSPEHRQLLAQAVAVRGPVTARTLESSLPDFCPTAGFDRIVAVEALTRSANPRPLFERMLTWLAPGGRLFVQIACHWRDSYFFEPGDENSWILPEVPDGALLPGQQYLNDLTGARGLLTKWELSGEHYERTARAWLSRFDENYEQLLAVLAAKGMPAPRRILRSWRDALLALQVMYGSREGQEWCVTQLLLGDTTSRVANSKTA